MNKYNLNKKDPDYHIEYFWYGFKQSMINFYYSINKDYNHISLWSEKLNNLKNNKEYNNIESEIRDYMSYYSFDLIKYSVSSYHDEILITNIKRWNKISNLFNFIQSTEHNKILLLFKIYLELKKDIAYKSFLSNLKPIEEILKYNLFDEFIEFALINYKIKILDLLYLIPNYDLIANITRLYPLLIIQDHSKIVKICNQFKNNYKF